MSLLTSVYDNWNCNEASGNLLATVSSSNDMTDHNTVGTGTGAVGNARSFTASSSEYFSLSSGTVSTLPLTVAFWFNANAITGHLLCAGINGSDNFAWGLKLNAAGGTLQFFAADGSASFITLDSSRTLNTATWYHAAIVWRTSTDYEIYLNAVSVGTGSTSRSPSGSQNKFVIGTYLDASGGFFGGLIDEFSIWSKALSTAEIEDLYNDGHGLAYSDWGKPDSPSAELTTSLTAYWNLDEASSASNAADATGNGNDLTAVSSPGTGSSTPGNYRSFDGSSQYFTHADSAALSLGDIDVTMCAFVNFTSMPASTTPPIIAKWNADYEFDVYCINNSLRFAGSGSELTSGTTINTGTWYFVVAMRDSSNDLKWLFVNASSKDSLTGSSTGFTDGSANFRLGADDFGGRFNGNMAKAGLWKRRLYPWERRYLYNSGSGRAYSDFAGGAAFIAARPRILNQAPRRAAFW